ncbi:alpha/beta fold hydrolase [Cryptosporangium aurantiacum]|uniref:Pimeloyl-ACP methyl ester carboxylesterase n=1 Tax=Cryptosporangium aurantiacum TaxID=134849 RepID=A0A1M7R3V0_9ACTN|nr:alpha/beta hydrolase [Cryptosporangium aurantiacum]SHN39866.1 Pimeloyl-ACP methyl ester carboxylesterase [Cryptosporangium aurantiacum]
MAGADVRYAVHGTGSRDLVLVHGSRAHSGWWHAVMPLLTADRRVITVDLSGHGDSAHRASYDGWTWAAELLAVADAVGAGRPLVVAHSLGGRVALYAATVQPDRFAGLVLLDTGLWAPGSLRERIGTRRPARVYPTYAEARARFRLTPPQPELPAAVLDPVAEYGLRAVPGGWAWKHDPAELPHLYGDDVERCAATGALPVCYVSGALSSVVNPAFAERAAVVHPGWTTVRLPGAHHHLPLEEPEACAELIRTAPRTPRSPVR